MYKVLFLQPKAYFDELGVDFESLESTFGLVLTINLSKSIRNYDLIVSCIDHDIESREIMLIANKLAVPTLFLMDGIYDRSNALNNPLLKKRGIQLLEPFVYKNIFVMGAVFKKYLEKKYDVKVFEYLPKRAQLQLTEEPEKVDFLLTTAITPYFDDVEFNILINWFRAVVNVLDSLDCNYHIRIFDKKILDAIPELNIKNNTIDTLSLAISKVNTVICTTSTVLHSSQSYGVPNITLNYRNERLFFETTENINDIKNLGLIKNYIELKTDKDLINVDINKSVLLTEVTYEKSEETEVPLKSFQFFINLSFIKRLIYKSLSASFKRKVKAMFVIKAI